MKVRSKTLTVDRALYERLERAGKKYPKLYFFFSGGKESLIIATAVAEMVGDGRFEAKRLIVIFVDEEAIYPCVDRVVTAWARRFRRMGARFEWLCLPFKHYNCFNLLANDESFVLWEESARDAWVRPMPTGAMTEHPLFQKGDRYQQFGDRLKDAPTMIGIRAEESVQRSAAIAHGKGRTSHIYPLYDWGLNDVWLFLRQHKVEIPDAYLNMWKVGIPANRLRISQFFTIDTAQSLVRMVEFYPGLYEKILAREPNAYLAMYYWDSEMFRRMTSTRKKLEDAVDWEAKFYRELRESDRKKSYDYRVCAVLMMRHGKIIAALSPARRSVIFRDMYSVISTGDPKKRLQRSIYSRIGSMYYGPKGRGNVGKEAIAAGPDGSVADPAMGPTRSRAAERLQPEQGPAVQP